jgi:MFS family permease
VEDHRHCQCRRHARFLRLFLIGYVLAFILKDWQITYGQSAIILISAGLGAVPGAFFWGWMGDRIGRRKVFILTALNVACATGIMYFTPEQGGWISGWIFLSFFRFFVGFGNAGLIAVDIPLVQEFVPAYKRGWVSGLTTVLLPAGNILGAVSGWLLAPIIGWRGLFLVGLTPALLVLMIRYWVPESPRFLMRMGRYEEARKSLAWALQCDPNEIELPTVFAEEEKTRWRELFRYPRSMASACMVALSQTGGVGILMWITALFVMVLKITPAEASYLMIWVGILGIIGRIVASWMSDAFGRRMSGFVIGIGGAIAMARRILARCLHRHRVGVFRDDPHPALLRRCQLRDHRPLHRRSLAEPVARQRHGLQLWHRQSRQDHRPARPCPDCRVVGIRQPQADDRRDLPGALVPGVLVRAGRARLPLPGRGDQGPLDRGDRQNARRPG